MTTENEYPGSESGARQPRHDDLERTAARWTEPAAVLGPGGMGYGKSPGTRAAATEYRSTDRRARSSRNPRHVNMVTSPDGVHCKKAVELGGSGGDETTVSFLKDGTMVALVRRRTQTE